MPIENVTLAFLRADFSVNG